MIARTRHFLSQIAGPMGGEERETWRGCGCALLYAQELDVSGTLFEVSWKPVTLTSGHFWACLMSCSILEYTVTCSAVLCSVAPEQQVYTIPCHPDTPRPIKYSTYVNRESEADVMVLLHPESPPSAQEVLYPTYSIVTALDDTETETSPSISMMTAPLGPMGPEPVEAYASAIVSVPKSGMGSPLSS